MRLKSDHVICIQRRVITDKYSEHRCAAEIQSRRFGSPDLSIKKQTPASAAGLRRYMVCGIYRYYTSRTRV